MKHLFLKNWMKTALLIGACCGMTACDNDDDKHPTPTDITAVCGAYEGTMAVVEASPTTDENDEKPAGTPIAADVTDKAIVLNDFPVRDLIVKILGTEQGSDQIVEAIGRIDYEIPYTALMSEDKASVVMTLDPAPLTLTLPLTDGGQAREDEETAESEIAVTIQATTAAAYTLATEQLGFYLSVTGIQVGDTDLPEFSPFSLHFDLAKK